MTTIKRPTRVILHCSATNDFKADDVLFDAFGADTIDGWHRDRGWDRIGYHHVIRRTGVLERGRPESMQGAHTYGQNKDTIGVCYVGTKRPTPPQVEALCELFLEIFHRYRITPNQWHGHYQYNKLKECPGIPMSLLRKLFFYVLAFELGAQKP